MGLLFLDKNLLFSSVFPWESRGTYFHTQRSYELPFFVDTSNLNITDYGYF